MGHDNHRSPASDTKKRIVMASLSDEEILRRVQRGERTLYVELFDRYYGRVKRYAHSQGAEAADDLASETFLWAYRNVASCSLGEISYLGYLLRICRRLVLMERERPPGVTTYAPDEDEDIGRGDTAEGLLLGWRKETRESAVRGALQCLPAEDREVIYLAHDPDLSRQDIMTILDQSSFSAFTAHLYRAMQKLNALVGRQVPYDQVKCDL
jgi:DNA-directed RNA polymerase specialized sigma24 family protein